MVESVLSPEDQDVNAVLVCIGLPLPSLPLCFCNLILLWTNKSSYLYVVVGCLLLSRDTCAALSPPSVFSTSLLLSLTVLPGSGPESYMCFLSSDERDPF